MKVAVIKTGGKQYKIAENDTIKIEKIAGNEGDSIEFDSVLLIGDESDTKIGAPTVDGATVKATILKQGRSKKTQAFKYKRKVRYRKKIGHRQHFTEVKIEKIA